MESPIELIDSQARKKVAEIREILSRKPLIGVHVFHFTDHQLILHQRDKRARGSCESLRPIIEGARDSATLWAGLESAGLLRPLYPRYPRWK